MARAATAWPALVMRSASVAPDLSSSTERVSDTVSTAIWSGMNCLLSSMPGMANRWRLKALRPEGIAGRDDPVPVSVHEPALALLRGPVREAVRHHAAGRFALQGVVADGGSRLHRGADVAGFDKTGLTLSLEAVVLMFGPDARKTIGLQFNLDLAVVCTRPVHALLLPLH